MLSGAILAAIVLLLITFALLGVLRREQGELDAETADLLRDRYGKERQRLLNEGAADSVSALSGRRLLGIGFMLVAVVGVALWLIAANTDDRSGIEGVAGDVVEEGGVNLDDISNEEMEAVVAQNPDIPGMRLALADRYFTAGEFSNALTHYMYVLRTLEVKDPAGLSHGHAGVRQQGRQGGGRLLELALHADLAPHKDVLKVRR